MKIKVTAYLACAIFLMLVIGVRLPQWSAQEAAQGGVSIEKEGRKNTGDLPKLEKTREFPKSVHDVDTPDDAYYEIVNGQNPLNLNRGVVEERIKDGLLRMNKIGYKILRDGEVATIQNAYQKLIEGAVFMGGNYPLWGIEDEEYFVFSGSNGRENDLAFKSGYAVKKADGSIYRWFDLDYPGNRSRTR